MFSRKCVCKVNISKIVRALLAALSVNGLTLLVTFSHFTNLLWDLKTYTVTGLQEQLAQSALDCSTFIILGPLTDIIARFS